MFPSRRPCRWSSSAALSGARRFASRLPSPFRGERARERLAAEPPAEIVIDLLGLEQVHGAEASDVAIRNVRHVV
jgi:hypothetical protein